MFCFALNYEWAPQAQAHKDSILEDIDEQSRINKGKKNKRKTVIKASDIAIARNQMYEHSEGRRLWRIGYIPLDLSQKKMAAVEIYIRDEKGDLEKSIFAEKAGWNHRHRRVVLAQQLQERCHHFRLHQPRRRRPAHQDRRSRTRRGRAGQRRLGTLLVSTWSPTTSASPTSAST